MIGWIIKLLGGGILDRVFETINKATDSETERQKAKLEALQAFAQAQAAMMAGPGRWLLYIYAVPLGLYYAAVIGYSAFFCRGCAYPQTWTIAALPAPLDQWSWAIICSFFGYGAALQIFTRKGR